MRAPERVLPDKPPGPIIHHPDIRRMLATQRAFSEGTRLPNFYCGKHVDISEYGSDDEKREARSRLALITPIAKRFSSEIAKAAAFEYLMFSDYTTTACMWAMSAVAASGEDDAPFYRDKIDIAKLYFARILPRTEGLGASIRAGNSSIPHLAGWRS